MRGRLPGASHICVSPLCRLSGVITPASSPPVPESMATRSAASLSVRASPVVVRRALSSAAEAVPSLFMSSASRRSSSSARLASSSTRATMSDLNSAHSILPDPSSSTSCTRSVAMASLSPSKPRSPSASLNSSVLSAPERSTSSLRQTVAMSLSCSGETKPAGTHTSRARSCREDFLLVVPAEAASVETPADIGSGVDSLRENSIAATASLPTLPSSPWKTSLCCATQPRAFFAMSQVDRDREMEPGRRGFAPPPPARPSSTAARIATAACIAAALTLERRRRPPSLCPGRSAVWLPMSKAASALGAPESWWRGP
mmetsp:Transcript_22311/g.65790  ORF Transcript_22311/g.65790 Transcript_22311/m.65790 type:complete len:316 (+) Transcript_22311:399-1346(+)